MLIFRADGVVPGVIEHLYLHIPFCTKRCPYCSFYVDTALAGKSPRFLDALLAELTRGRLRAALDVTDPEPLPADHPLWSAPGLLLSPHVGGNSSAFLPRARALVRAQVARFAAGEPVENVVAGPPSSG